MQHLLASFLQVFVSFAGFSFFISRVRRRQVKHWRLCVVVRRDDVPAVLRQGRHTVRGPDVELGGHAAGPGLSLIHI